MLHFPRMITSLFIKKALLPFTVFLTGACVLVIEVVATRILSPYFGNTIFTVSSVISTILAALSIGYYAGGRIADKHPTFRWFFGLISASGLLLLCFHTLSIFLLPIISRSTSIMVGPLVSSLAFFFIPSLILGTLSPYAVVIQRRLDTTDGIGSIAGSMFFWSTLGSIAGSLAAGFILIPRLGVNAIMVSNSIALFILGSMPLIFLGVKKRSITTLAVLCAILSGMTFFSINGIHASSSVIFQKDGIYERITVKEQPINGRPARILLQDHTLSGATYLDTNDPLDTPFAYAAYAQLYRLVMDDADRILSIGGGTFTVARMYQSLFPNATIDAVEIEPSLGDLAKKYFSLKESPNLHLYTEDGRRFLDRSEGAYDIIFSDMYQSFFSIPSHATTKEFFLLAKQKLAPNGIFIANILGDLSRQEPSLFFSEINTMNEAFPNMAIFAVEDARTGTQNFIFAGFNRKEPMDISVLASDEHANAFIRELPKRLVDLRRFERSPYKPFTDQYAPTDYYSAQTISRVEKAPNGANGKEILAIIKQQMRYGDKSKGKEGNSRIREMLASELSAQLGAPVSATGTMIVAHLFPELNRRITVSARYDVGINQPSSGSAALVHLAQILMHANESPRVGIDLVFFESGNDDPSVVVKKYVSDPDVTLVDQLCVRKPVIIHMDLVTGGSVTLWGNQSTQERFEDCKPRQLQSFVNKLLVSLYIKE